MIDAPPWSDRVRLDQIGVGLTRRLEADAETRARVADALGLLELSALTADVSVKPAGAGWRLEGRVRASLAQACVITLEPVPADIDTAFSVDLVEAGAIEPNSRVIEADPEGPDGPDVVEDGGVDLAAYAVEHLALALDPYPRKPGAVFEPPAGEAEPSPFAVLAQLKPRT